MQGVTLGGEVEAGGCWRVEEGYREGVVGLGTSRRMNWVVVVVVVVEQQKQTKRVLQEIKKRGGGDSLAETKLVETHRGVNDKRSDFHGVGSPFGSPPIHITEIAFPTKMLV